MFILKRSINRRGFKNSTSKLQPELVVQTSKMNEKTNQSNLGIKHCNQSKISLAYAKHSYEQDPMVTFFQNVIDSMISKKC